MVSDWVEAVHLRVEHDFGFELLDFLLYVCHFPHNGEQYITASENCNPKKSFFLKKVFFIFRGDWHDYCEVAEV